MKPIKNHQPAARGADSPVRCIADIPVGGASEPSERIETSIIRRLESLRNGRPGGLRYNAFSMIELMATVALLSVIILGLVAMFSQTRRAFTSSISQVDVLESGRSAADFIARELEQMTPFGETTGTIPNFYADTPNMNNFNQFIWPLTAPGDLRTNNLEETFFITHNNQQWNIIGYKVFISPNIPVPDRALGSLYRFYDSFTVTNAAKNLPQLATRINNDYNVFIQVPTTTPGTGFTHLVDGVVDFRVRAYTTNGVQFYFNYSTNSDFKMNNNLVPGDYSYLFLGASIPAYVEVELGVVEDRVLAHYNALTNNPGIALGYLTNHSAQLHIFRQRVPVLNVNPAAL